MRQCSFTRMKLVAVPCGAMRHVQRDVPRRRAATHHTASGVNESRDDSKKALKGTETGIKRCKERCICALRMNVNSYTLLSQVEYS